MSGGHSGGHGHDGHGAHPPPHGHAEIPPAPQPRLISPARADYAQPWPGPLLVWPLAWLGVAALLFVAARTWSPDWRHEGHEGHGAHGAHGAHGTPTPAAEGHGPAAPAPAHPDPHAPPK